ncbi:MAG: L,D-transpeptidase [Puniceicoccales bacterium]|jgi:hypothetical protein|nr:L,D-transpeptidase [Puniceicoccales bacterium]
MNIRLPAVPEMVGISLVEYLQNVWPEYDGDNEIVGDMAVYVSIAEQRAYIFSKFSMCAIYNVSTGANPPCNTQNSNGTPLGWHEISEKYGDGAPEGTVFIARQSTGSHFTAYDDWQTKGYVTTRILRLRGLEMGKNAGLDENGHCCDTYDRYIYFHGSCFPEKLGSPHSMGCINMSSADIVKLYELLPEQTRVYIGP